MPSWILFAEEVFRIMDRLVRSISSAAEALAFPLFYGCIKPSPLPDDKWFLSMIALTPLAFMEDLLELITLGMENCSLAR